MSADPLQEPRIRLDLGHDDDIVSLARCVYCPSAMTIIAFAFLVSMYVRFSCSDPHYCVCMLPPPHRCMLNNRRIFASPKYGRAVYRSRHSLTLTHTHNTHTRVPSLPSDSTDLSIRSRCSSLLPCCVQTFELLPGILAPDEPSLVQPLSHSFFFCILSHSVDSLPPLFSVY